jgi:catechol 2,3-dioxygenase-like lactoylglutathione lyase family enzyme
MQNAFVVEDLERAIDHWTGVMGVGPFFMFEHIAFRNVVYRGRPAPPIDLTVAIGYWDNLQIELIRQHDEAPSIYREFTTAHGSGMHHMGVMSNSLELDLADLAQVGVLPVLQGSAAGMRFAYVATDHHPGGMIELIEASAGARAFFARMREAARDWDGRDPIRRPE